MYEPQCCCENELDNHMCSRHKQWIWKAKVVMGKHPFIIQGEHRCEREPRQMGRQTFKYQVWGLIVVNV